MLNSSTKEKVLGPETVFHWFIIYSFFGWIYETIYCYIDLGRYTKRGFLSGPVCPIYGVCIVLAIILFQERIKSNVLLFFLCGFCASVMEYIVSCGMEYIFERRWWNYSNMMFNLNGRICLEAAIVFGINGILILRFIHPKLVELMDEYAQSRTIKRASRIIFGIFLFDLMVTVQMNLS